MSYRNIGYGHITDPRVRELFHRADLYIGDAYSMFYLPYKGWRSGGGCNFAIVVTLVCVVDGVAKYIYPAGGGVRQSQQRFKRLLRDKLSWGPSSKGWMDRNLAARLLYVAFRNPLVHQLGQDTPSTHPVLQKQPIVGKWGSVPTEMRNIDRVDRMKEWDVSWPTMSVERRDGRLNVKLTAAGFYWSVKRMVADLAKGIA